MTATPTHITGIRTVSIPVAGECPPPLLRSSACQIEAICASPLRLV
jgi:hypothetical protein